MKIENLKETELMLVSAGAGGTCLCYNFKNIEGRWTTQTFSECREICCQPDNFVQAFTWRESPDSKSMTGHCATKEKSCYRSIIDLLKSCLNAVLSGGSTGLS